MEGFQTMETTCGALKSFEPNDVSASMSAVNLQPSKFILSLSYPDIPFLPYLPYLLLFALAKPFLSLGALFPSFYRTNYQPILQHWCQLRLPEDLACVTWVCEERIWLPACAVRGLQAAPAAGGHWLLLGPKGLVQCCCTKFKKLQMTLLVFRWMNCMWIIENTCPRAGDKGYLLLVDVDLWSNDHETKLQTYVTQSGVMWTL